MNEILKDDYSRLSDQESITFLDDFYILDWLTKYN